MGQDCADTARGDRWPVTEEDQGGFGPRGKRGETEPKRLAHPPLRIRIANPANRPRHHLGRFEPGGHDRNDRIKAGADGALQDVLQQRTAAQLRKLLA